MSGGNDGVLNVGIVGTGFIAGVIARSLERSERARLRRVASRERSRAEAFVASYPGAVAEQGYRALCEASDVDAVYVATPTSTKEAIASCALDNGKHVLVDKPFTSTDSVQRLTERAKAAGLVLMDATHFVHHPRHHVICDGISELVGTPQTLFTSFYFPSADADNIRFDTELEPMGAIGDMAWYSMRATVEYLRPGNLESAWASAQRDPSTGALVQASGGLRFEDGKTSIFDIGYTAGTLVMDLSLKGDRGVLDMDDFVLDWRNSFAFDNPGLAAGYFHRSGLATRGDTRFTEIASNVPQDVRMLDELADACIRGQEAWSSATIATQALLDEVWRAARKQSS